MTNSYLFINKHLLPVEDEYGDDINLKGIIDCLKIAKMHG